MKLAPFLFGLVLAFASLASAVEAYGIYGASSFPTPYGYRESTDFYTNFNAVKSQYDFNADADYFNEVSGDEFADLFQSSQGSGTVGYANTFLQDFLQDNDVSLNNGYSFTKGPCVTEKIRGNFRGKDNDFKITREVCDNIEGTFFKDNSLNNRYVNSGQVGLNEFGNQAYQNQFNNQNTASRSYTNQQSASASEDIFQKMLQVSFGKGTRIVLN